MIVLAKRYHKNPQCAFPTFQMDVQMQSSIINHVAKGSYFFEKALICWPEDIWNKGLLRAGGTCWAALGEPPRATNMHSPLRC